MKLRPEQFSFKQRAADKAAARAQDEVLLRSGSIPPGKMARTNGGAIRGVRHVGPSAEIRRLVSS